MAGFDTEVLIVGGGLVGNTLAGLLGREGMDCIVIDASKKNGNNIGSVIDPRALAITVASQRILQSFDLWKRLPEQRLGYFRSMSVWDENGTGRIDFDSADICHATMGYIVEQSILQNALQEVVSFIPTVSVINDIVPKFIYWEENGIILESDQQRQFRAKLIIGADGVNSQSRELAGIEYKTHDYQQQALACVVKTVLSHDQVARQRFLTDGPLAFLPMADDQQCGVVWSTSPEHAGQLLELDAESFNHALQTAFENTLGDVLESGPRASFVLKRAQADNYCRDRFALIGDAAHCLHPLAGQGANLGLLDAASLAQVVLDARAKGKDFGRLRVLRQYERWRKGENHLMMMVLEGFKILFENQNQPLPLLRNAGLNFVNFATPLKHSIMRRAMGLDGDLPKFARA